MRATVKDAELCFGIARAASVAGFQHVFPPDLYEFPADAIRADWISALTDPDGETYLSVRGRPGRRSGLRGPRRHTDPVREARVLEPRHRKRASRSSSGSASRSERPGGAPLDTHGKPSSARLLRETRMESHRPDAGRAVPASSDRRRVCPLDTSQLAASGGICERELSAYPRLPPSGRRDSNPRHLAWEASALPTELRPRWGGILAPQEIRPCGISDAMAADVE